MHDNKKMAAGRIDRPFGTVMVALLTLATVATVFCPVPLRADRADRHALPPLTVSPQFDHAWDPVGPEGGEILAMAEDPSDPDAVYALIATSSSCRIFKTEDFGTSWSLQATADHSFFDLAVDPIDQTTLYASEYNDLYKSSDGGQTWDSYPITASSCIIYDVHPSPAPPYPIYAAGAADVSGYKMAVFKSEDGGASWDAATFKTSSLYGYLMEVAAYPNNPDTVYACGFYYQDAAMHPMVLRSDDGAQTWSEVIDGLTGTRLEHIIVHPESPDIVFCSGADGLFRSDDAGDSWQLVQAGQIYGLAIDPSAPNYVYAGAAQGVYRSSNGGQSWSLVGGGLFENFVYQPVVHRQDGTTLLAGTRHGVHRSESRGQVWRPAQGGLFGTQISILAAAPSNPDVVYAAVGSDALHKSLDGGDSWARCGSFFGCANIQALAVDPADAEKIYAFTGG